MQTVQSTRLSTQELAGAAARLPRINLAHLPTPLDEVPRFSEAIQGPRIFIKRDDCTGLAFGGNKTRHNEFIFSVALERKAQVVLWCAGVQSNNCRQTAATCAKLGMECHLVLTRAAHSDDVQGNLLLDHILGAKVEIVDTPIGPALDDLVASKARLLIGTGKRVFFWDRELIKPRAAASYALCVAETVDQLQARGLQPGGMYISSGGSTGAGMVLGHAALGLTCPLRIVSPISWPWNHAQDLAETANKSAELLEIPTRVEPKQVDTTLDFIGPGYGLVTDAGMEAMRLLAQTEGILLDPVYTSKAMAALIADVRQGRYRRDDVVVFVHTGGTPANFAYRDEIMRGLAKK